MTPPAFDVAFEFVAASFSWAPLTLLLKLPLNLHHAVAFALS
jgi:hypothetical protein